MSNFFGSIKEVPPEKVEVTYQWLPLEFYNYEEIEKIKETSIKYTKYTYTLLEDPPQTTNFFDN